MVNATVDVDDVSVLVERTVVALISAKTMHVIE